MNFGKISATALRDRYFDSIVLYIYMEELRLRLLTRSPLANDRIVI